MHSSEISLLLQKTTTQIGENHRKQIGPLANQSAKTAEKKSKCVTKAPKLKSKLGIL